MKIRAWMLAGLMVPWLLMACCSESLAQTPVWKFLAGTPTTPAINDTITPQAGLSAAQQGTFNQGITFTAESTVVFAPGGFGTIVLIYRVIPVAPDASGDTTSTVRLAIAAKVWPSDFSTQTWPDSMACVFDTPNIIAGFLNGDPPPVGSGPGLWPGEIERTIDPWAGRALRSNTYFGITGHALNLNQALGVASYRGALMQIRIRVLSYGVLTVKPRIQAWVMGFN